MHCGAEVNESSTNKQHHLLTLLWVHDIDFDTFTEFFFSFLEHFETQQHENSDLEQKWEDVPYMIIHARRPAHLPRAAPGFVFVSQLARTMPSPVERDPNPPL